jgi:arsenate reductase (thioredoxin)
MAKLKVLFVCVHNSARSQMAEAYLKKFGGDKFEVESAGIEKGVLNPVAVEVMKEDGIDISHNPTKSAFDLFKQGKSYLYVITVCDKSAADRCPYFPGVNKRIIWNFDDPSAFIGTHEEKLQQTRQVRDSIKQAVQNFINDFNK